MPFTAPSYVSDADIYYASDWNRDIVDNENYMFTYANSNAAWSDGTFSGVVQYSSEVPVGSVATDFSVNFGKGNRQNVTLTGGPADITLLTSDLTVGNYLLRIVMDTDSLTYAFDSDAVLAVGGTMPTPSSDAGAHDLIGLYYSGAKFYVIGTTGFK